MKAKIFFGVFAFTLAVLLLMHGVATAQGPAPRAPGAAMGTAFTYQGQLKKSGSPVTSTCTFTFGLWDAASGGAQLGSNQTVSGVSVSNGLFTATLNSGGQFGTNAFTGDARWLAISVQCTGDGSATSLGRQPLTPAPYALALPGLYTQQHATSPNVIGGYSSNSVTSGVYGATIGGGGGSGWPNRVTDDFGTVGGGYRNQAGDNAGSTSDRRFATVGGGHNNTAGNYGSTIGGGEGNTASGNSTTIGGGNANFADNFYTTVGGGKSNTASGAGAFVGGGGWDGTTTSGNTASGNASVIGGGMGNTAIQNSATVGGGRSNTASGAGAFVGGGGYDGATTSGNTASGNASTIGGGYGNTSSARAATVGGGESNNATGNSTTVAGGYYNSTGGAGATVGGGTSNTAPGNYATVGGGNSNTASGSSATVPGGANNTAAGQSSFAAGYRAKANHTGAFVWSDYSEADVASTADNQFVIRATNGVSLTVDAGPVKGVSVGDRYRDNAIVAWASIYWNGTIDKSFGVQSVTKLGTGQYSITLYALAASTYGLIPVATAEVDAAPTSAAALRIVSVNQINSKNVFEVYINDGTGTLVDNDFIVIVTAR